MSLIEFPYTLHKGYLLPIIPITVLSHWVWVFVDSGATFTILSVDDAFRIGIDWQRGKQQMIMVGDGSFIPVYFQDLSIQIDKWQVTAPIGFSERLGVGFNLLGRKGIFDQFQVCFNDHIRKVTFQKI
jgi:predicted aspartyl protease